MTTGRQQCSVYYETSFHHTGYPTSLLANLCSGSPNSLYFKDHPSIFKGSHPSKPAKVSSKVHIPFLFLAFYNCLIYLTKFE